MKLKFRLPPSGFKPHSIAIASSSVDLPDPFSPTKKVTFGWNAIRSMALNGGEAIRELIGVRDPLAHQLRVQ